MNLKALLTKTVKMDGVVVIAIGRHAARVNVHQTVNTHPGSVLGRVLSRDVMLAAFTKLVKVDFKILVLRKLRVKATTSNARTRFRVDF